MIGERMIEKSVDTVWIHERIQRWQRGDTGAADELLRAVARSLERLTRKMLRHYPAIRAWVETADVLQGSVLRLLHTLQRMMPESTRHFNNLAAVHIRRELLDLGRRFQREPFTRLLPTGGVSSHGPAFPKTLDRTDEDLEWWCQFHEAVEMLSPDEREVMSLVFYHGWTQVQIAELLEVDERTVRRRWQAACLQLQDLVGDRLPSP